MMSPFRAPTDADRALHAEARTAIEHAYVPYSKFRVGAAIRLDDGRVVHGCNVENASYGLTVCAERTAIVRLIAEGLDPARIEAIAVHVDGPDGQPCGACRQVLAEFMPDRPIAFLAGGELVACDVRDLMPSAFVPGALEG